MGESIFAGWLIIYFILLHDDGRSDYRSSEIGWRSRINFGFSIRILEKTTGIMGTACSCWFFSYWSPIIGILSTRRSPRPDWAFHTCHHTYRACGWDVGVAVEWGMAEQPLTSGARVDQGEAIAAPDGRDDQARGGRPTVAKLPLAEALLANLLHRLGERRGDQAMIAAGKRLAEHINEAYPCAATPSDPAPCPLVSAAPHRTRSLR